jgi:AcrR family transcriptional regulator
MPKRKGVAVSPRKQPKQQRSTELVDAILQAAIRVLEREGASAFTTIRVAEQAGVSVGSLYQYFPNKQSILFRLQQDEWDATGKLLDGIFSDQRLSAAERLRSALHAFFRTEYDEAPLRRALGDAAPLYRDAPQARAHRERGLPMLLQLIREAAPGLSARRRAFAAELYIATMSAMGKHASETTRSRAELERWAAATADMFLAYLADAQRG